jgi:hypothetical protein
MQPNPRTHRSGKLFRWIYPAIAALLSLWGLRMTGWVQTASVQPYQNQFNADRIHQPARETQLQVKPDSVLQDDVLPQLQNIKRRLRQGEGDTMQALFPEGWFFSHVLYGYTWINVGLSSESPALRQQAIQEVQWVLAQADSAKGRKPFPAKTQVQHGVFYLGWINRLLGGLLKLQSSQARSPQDIDRFKAQSAELAQAFQAHPNLTLDAYPGEAWSCDQTVALASLALHDDLFGSNYRSIIRRWVNHAQQHLDPKTGLIPHKVDATTHEILIPARGSSQVYLLPFLAELDHTFATQQYLQFRQQFVSPTLGLLPVREYPIGESGKSDVDSGPLIFGLGPTSTIVSIAPAKLYGDSSLFESTLAIVESLALPIVWGEEKSYALGQLIVLDGFFVWGKTIVPWTNVSPRPIASTPPIPSEPRPKAAWWIGTGMILLLLWAPWGRSLWKMRKNGLQFRSKKQSGYG